MFDDVAQIMRSAAERFVLPRFRRPLDARDKGGGDPVTAADLEAEAFLRARLSEVWSAPVVGEEGWGPRDRARLASGRAWIVDPLDGTRIFLEGDDRFAMIVARVDEGRTVDGWLYFPARGEMYATAVAPPQAERGAPRPAGFAPGRLALGPQGGLRVHAGDAPGRYRLHHVPKPTAALRALEAAGWRPDGPTCWELRRLLTGEPGGYVCSHVTPWDLAAGVALMRAAGGAVRRADGAPVRPTDEAGVYVFGPTAPVVDRWIDRFGLGDLEARSPIAGGEA